MLEFWNNGNKVFRPSFPLFLLNFRVISKSVKQFSALNLERRAKIISVGEPLILYLIYCKKISQASVKNLPES